MGPDLTATRWRFQNRGKTTAEIIRDLYRAVRQGAGDPVLIGCNTMGHLAAGLVEAQRIGDDTSGRDWSRTRKMGVNTLAFRMAQHDTFFAADADCVPLTRNPTPWSASKLIGKTGRPGGRPRTRASAPHSWNRPLLEKFGALGGSACPSQTFAGPITGTCPTFRA
jgi:hypothetical protein